MRAAAALARILAVGFLLLPGACAGLPADLGRGVTAVTDTVLGRPPADQAYVVVGVAVRRPLTKLFVASYDVSLGWIRYDPATQARQSGDAQSAPWTVVRCTALTVNCSGAANYSILAVPPGDYALAWVYSGDSEWMFADFAERQTARGAGTTYPTALSADARIRRDGMRFTVRPGEAVYVGDISVDLQAAQGTDLGLQRGENDAAARQALADRGIRTEMTVRPWRERDGTGLAQAAP